MATRLPPLLDPALLLAHRSGGARSESDTLSAVAQAIRLGATGIHVTVWTTRDGEIVVDGTGVVRRLPRRTVADVDRADLPERFIALRRLVAQTAPLPLRLTLGEGSGFGAVVEVVREGRAAAGVWIEHDSLDVLRDWRDAAPDIGLLNRVHLQALPFGPERRAAELAAARIDGVAMAEADWSGGLVTLFHRFNVLAFSHGAHHERQIARLIDMGVDAVSGDHADRLAAVAATFA